MTTATAGIVLAGGRSSRMGTAKAALEWHGSTLLRQVTGVVQRAVDGPVLVVRAPGQELPDLDGGVVLCDDVEEGLGPMQGLAVGLGAASEHAEVAFVCSTDLPFLHSAFARAVLTGFEAGEEVDVVLPIVRGFRQPLIAGYRTALAAVAQTMLDEGQLRLGQLLDRCRVRTLDEDALLADPVLAAVDPKLDSVANVNEPDDYRAARGRPAPEVTVEAYGDLAAPGGGAGGPLVVRAANLGHAAARVGLTLDGRIVVSVNGDEVRSDAGLPLLTGDTVSFISADA